MEPKSSYQETYTERTQRLRQEAIEAKRTKREHAYGWMRDYVGEQVLEYFTESYGKRRKEPCRIKPVTVISVTPSAAKIRLDYGGGRVLEFLPDYHTNEGYNRKFAPLDDPTLSVAYAAQEQAKQDKTTAEEQAKVDRVNKIASGGIPTELAKFIKGTSASPGPWVLMPDEGEWESTHSFSVLDAEGKLVMHSDARSYGSGDKSMDDCLSREGNQQWLANLVLLTAARDLLDAATAYIRNPWDGALSALRDAVDKGNGKP